MLSFSQLLQEASPLRFLSLIEFSNLSAPFVCKSCCTEGRQRKKTIDLYTPTLPGFSGLAADMHCCGLLEVGWGRVSPC